MRRLIFLPAAVVLAGLAVACDDDDFVGPDPQDAVGSVVISPESGELFVGETLQLSSEVWSVGGRLLELGVDWDVDDPALATISEDGLLLALGEGVVNVTAIAEGVVGTMAVSISVATPPVVAGWIVIEPEGPIVLAPGSFIHLEAMPYDETGTPHPEWEVVWAISNDHAAAYQTGEVMGLSVGDVMVTASSHGVSDQVLVKVRDPTPPVASIVIDPAVIEVGVGQQVQVNLTAYDANGNVVVGWVDWSSANPGMVSVDKTGTGNTTVTVVSAPVGAPVTVDVTGICDGKPGTLTVEVLPRHE